MNRRLLGNLGGRRDGTASTWNVPPQHPACGTPRTSKVAWGAPHFRTAPSPVPWPPRRHLLDAPIAGAYAPRANRCRGPLPQRAACPPEAQARCRCRSSWVPTWGGAWKPKEGRSFSRGTSRRNNKTGGEGGSSTRAARTRGASSASASASPPFSVSRLSVCLRVLLAEQRASLSVSLPLLINSLFLFSQSPFLRAWDIPAVSESVVRRSGAGPLNSSASTAVT